MDCNRLPHGNTNAILYMYKHLNAKAHVQHAYDETYTVNPKTVITPVISRDKTIAIKNNEIKTKKSVMGLIVQDTPKTTTENIEVVTHDVEESNTEATTESNAVATTESNAVASTESTTELTTELNAVVVTTTDVSVKPQEQQIFDSWRFMVSHIDDTSSLYTENMWRDAIDSMKQKLIVLMTSGVGHKKYGPKKSRTILAWLTDNKRGTPASPETALVIADFIGWLLDTKVSSVETSVANAPWIMYRKRGVWMLRNNI